MQTLVDVLGKAIERDSGNRNVAASLMEIFKDWPRDDRVEHSLQEGITHMLAGKPIAAQRCLAEAMSAAEGGVLEKHLACVASNILAANTILLEAYSGTSNPEMYH